MPAWTGTGTSTSPFAFDSDSDDDSEVEVLNELTHRRGTSEGGSSPRHGPMQHDDDLGDGEGSGSMNVDESLKSDEKNQRNGHANGDAVERGIKRQRSESVMSRGSALSAGASELRGQPSAGHPQQPAGESRKAKKRRRKAERNKELYLERWRRLQDAPNLVPQYPPGLTPFEAANMNPFAFLPQFHDNLVNVDFSYPTFYPAGQWMEPNAGMLGLPAVPQQQQPEEPWGFQPHNPQFEGSFNSAPMSPLDASSTSATVGSHSLPPKPIVRPPPQIVHPEPTPVQRIGVEHEHDPNSKHGVFKIPETVLDNEQKQYIPTPACTLVLEQLPKSHRNSDFVSAWCRKACGQHPAKVLIDQSGAKALVEFPSREAAEAAWGSPRLSPQNIGVKSHLLKGKPREDLIKAYWYRVDGVSNGVGEIEEGEIQEATEKAVVRKESKKDRKARLAKQREEKEERARQRQREAAASSNVVPSSSGTSQLHWTSTTSLNPPPNGLPQRPSHLPAPPAPSHAGLIPMAATSTNGIPPRMTIETGGSNVVGQENDDMDLSSPSPTSPSMPFDGAFPSQPPASALSHAAPPFTPSIHRVPSGPRAMQNLPTEPTHHLRRKQQDANNNGINGTHHLHKAMQQHPLPQLPLQPPPPQTAPPALPSAPPPPPPSQPTVSTILNATEAMEASLRERVLKSRLKGKAKETPPSISTTPSPTESAPSPVEVPTKNTLAPVVLDTVDSFLASVVSNTPKETKSPTPPPPGLPLALTTTRPALPTRTTSSALMAKNNANAELERAEMLERNAAMGRQLMEQFEKAKTKAEKDAIRASLREMAREEAALKAATATSANPAAAAGPMRPSAKINLDYTLPPRPSRTTVTSKWSEDQSDEQHILIISDEEESDDDQ